MKSSLQAAQPVNGRGLALMAELQEDGMAFGASAGSSRAQRRRLVLWYLQLFNGHALVEQPFGRAVVTRPRPAGRTGR